VYVSPDDHAGKILGLYAQTYSSYVFERAFESVHFFLRNTKSCIIFPVHDELVIDMHPDDFELADKIRDIMQSSAGGGWKIKVRKGKSYSEQN
jgi:DNA polymerase I-like protein with 3'-5' exonuclease and polymerase domains